MLSATEVNFKKMAKRHQFSGARPLLFTYTVRRYPRIFPGPHCFSCYKMDAQQALCVQFVKKGILFVYLAKLVEESHTH